VNDTSSHTHFKLYFSTLVTVGSLVLAKIGLHRLRAGQYNCDHWYV